MLCIFSSDRFRLHLGGHSILTLLSQTHVVTVQNVAWHCLTEIARDVTQDAMGTNTPQLRMLAFEFELLTLLIIVQ